VDTFADGNRPLSPRHGLQALHQGICKGIECAAFHVERRKWRLVVPTNQGFGKGRERLRGQQRVHLLERLAPPPTKRNTTTREKPSKGATGSRGSISVGGSRCGFRPGRVLATNARYWSWLLCRAWFCPAFDASWIRMCNSFCFSRLVWRDGSSAVPAGQSIYPRQDLDFDLHQTMI
jgi:hypothetical protein